MNKLAVQTQIGAFQFESSKEEPEERVKPFLDKSGDLDLNRLGDIVLYSFANYEYFQDINVSVSPVILSELEAKYIQAKAEASAEEADDEEPDTAAKKPFELSGDDIKQSAAMKKSSAVLNEGIFTIDKTTKRIAMLPEETKEDADKQKGEYTDRAKQSWIEKYMSNNHFDIVETADNGDCFFDVVRLAFAQIGYETTIKKLRAIIARDATDEMFHNYRDLFITTGAEIADVEKELRRMVQENKNLKERLAAMPKTEKAARAEVILAANTIKEQHSKLKEKQAVNRAFLEEFHFMHGIDTMDKFREIIQTPSYWADDWAISVIERELNVKMCIFSEEDYEANDENNVIRCSLSGDSFAASGRPFDPEFYIMTTYSGKHYRLITYKNKRILHFSEVPYDVKTMVVIKCMEKNSGVFSEIQDFKNFKSRLGVEEDPDEPVDTSSLRLDLDENVIFTFYNKSSGTAKPGKAANEKLPAAKKREYTDLELKSNEDWRRKLDDDWSTLFTVDGKKWKSVEHYYQAAKFKKHNPHFYAKFSLSDSTKEFADDVEVAKAAGSEKGILKKGKKEIPLRPVEIKIDPDFYGTRRSEEREKALYAKFSQSEDLKTVLLATKNAVLKQYVPKQAATPDHLLMKVRERIAREN
jgi:predicted NAD-dependent protein-ADP-ribosyltransferase YbiA (DUF1768 family)